MPVEFYPTVILPLTKERQIDYLALDRLAGYFFQHGANGLFLDWQADKLAGLAVDAKLALARFCINCCHKAGRKCFILVPARDRSLLAGLAGLGADALVFPDNQLAGLAEQLPESLPLGIISKNKRSLPADILASGRFSLLFTDCSQTKATQLLAQCQELGLRLYNTDAASILQSCLAGATGYCGNLFGFIPQIFAVLQGYLAGGAAGLPYDQRRAAEFAQFIAMASPWATHKYPAGLEFMFRQQGLISSGLLGSGADLTAAEKKQLDALAGQAIRQRSRADVFAGRQLAFAQDRFFPSCHAATILPLPSGTILLAYFAGTAEGNPDVAIWLSRYIRGSWQDPVQLAKVDQTAHWNPVLFQDRGTVRLVFKVGPRIRDWQSWSVSSVDEGKTWSAPVRLATDDHAPGPVRSKPLLLSNGDLLAGNSVETKSSWQPQVDISTDGGRTFNCLAKIPLNRKDPAGPDYLAGLGAIQPVLWESAPGQVHLLLRTTAGWIFRSDSTDFGRTWCRAYRTGLPGNNSGVELVQQGKNLYLIFNPVQGNWAARNPLVIWHSSNNGSTFSHYLTLENSAVDPLTQKDAEYSYPAAVAAGGKIYLAYTCNRRQMACCIIDLPEQEQQGCKNLPD